MFLKKFLASALMIVLAQFKLYAVSKVVEEDLSKYFKGFIGTFVMYDASKDTYTIYNRERAEKRFAPMSTFKIPNSMIFLETGVVKDTKAKLKWDGKKGAFPFWERDHNLETALKNSVVPFYQHYARQVGAQKMQEFLHKFNYGNKDISGGIDRFWLSSSLKISAREQVDFLRKFCERKLPVSKKNMDAVHGILENYYWKFPEVGGAQLFGKTGSGIYKEAPCSLGWYVGYNTIPHGDDPKKLYVFAVNIDVPGQKSGCGYIAREIAVNILISKGLNPQHAVRYLRKPPF